LQKVWRQGGGDFIFSLLPVDAVDTTDRRIDYATQDSREGSHVGTFRTPAEPGDYLLVFHRNAQMPIDEVMERFVITVEARPEVRLIAPRAVEPGARVPVTFAGGMGDSDRIEIWRDGALYSWDQSVYIQEFFDNRYGPAKPLLAPTEPGEYEIVYVFTGIDGPEAVAARQPLMVGAVPYLDEASATTETSSDTQIAAIDATGDASSRIGRPAFSLPCLRDGSRTFRPARLPPRGGNPGRSGSASSAQPSQSRASRSTRNSGSR
jgi:Ca-activated chloride channel family protein